MRSNSSNHRIAYSRLEPHISADGCNPAQNPGRSGRPKIRQRLSSPNCTQRIPAGLPCGIPGIGLVMEGAVQHAPQLSRHFIANKTDKNETESISLKLS